MLARRLRHVSQRADTFVPSPFSVPLGLPDEARQLTVIGVGKPAVQWAFRAAERNGTRIDQELIAANILDEEMYARFLAEILGVSYFPDINPDSIILLPHIDALLKADSPLRIVHDDRTMTVIVPSLSKINGLRDRLSREPDLKKRFAFATRRTVRAAVWQARAPQRVREAALGLDEDRRSDSARSVLTGGQAFLLSLFLSLILTSFILWPSTTLTGVHIFLTVFFLVGIAIRLAACITTRPVQPVRAPPSKSLGKLPCYTVLVALHDEADMVPALVGRLSHLDWPKSLLDIKFVIEEKDHKTFAALTKANLLPCMEVVRVPAFGPLTKPKALAYALKGARGDFLTIYDAEDRPHPSQLVEAWQAFDKAGPRLGCLQAPLAIANMRMSFFAALFTLEYAGLFRRLLPFLCRSGLPVPLGGTSNHFRLSALEAVGGWDPFNVTEDADLGLRLARAGYTIGTLTLATIEAAPATIPDWIRQRSRWLKGWMQTWLVVMRQPLVFARSTGLKGFACFQVLTGGMILSALFHPLMYGFAAHALYKMGSGESPTTHFEKVMLSADLLAIAGSWAAFILMGWGAMTPRQRHFCGVGRLCGIAIYWLAMSLAGWRALYQMFGKTHVWEKTPHHPISGAPGK